MQTTFHNLLCNCMQDYVLGEREGEVGVLVKAGMHEVDMAKRRMQPCYWPGTFHRVIRGSWYVDKGSGYAPLKVIATVLMQLTHRATAAYSRCIVFAGNCCRRVRRGLQESHMGSKPETCSEAETRRHCSSCRADLSLHKGAAMLSCVCSCCVVSSSKAVDLLE